MKITLVDSDVGTAGAYDMAALVALRYLVGSVAA